MIDVPMAFSRSPSGLFSFICHLLKEVQSAAPTAIGDILLSSFMCFSLSMTLIAILIHRHTHIHT